MVVGLGSGSTAEIALELLAARRLRIVGVPTSERTAQLARARGIALAGLDTHPTLDLAIDGADQVEQGSLDMIKGLGGALLREKLVATAARRLLVMVDEGKLVDRLGDGLLPVEIVAWGWRATLERLDRDFLANNTNMRMLLTDIATTAAMPVLDAPKTASR